MLCQAARTNLQKTIALCVNIRGIQLETYQDSFLLYNVFSVVSLHSFFSYLLQTFKRLYEVIVVGSPFKIHDLPSPVIGQVSCSRCDFPLNERILSLFVIIKICVPLLHLQVIIPSRYFSSSLASQIGGIVGCFLSQSVQQQELTFYF